MKDTDRDWLKYGDLGVLLGSAIHNNNKFNKIETCQADETMHATVIGAGNCSMSVSGSTISSKNVKFPIRNIPVFPVKYEKKEDLDEINTKMINFYLQQKKYN